jgi:hypothetical protein
VKFDRPRNGRGGGAAAAAAAAADDDDEDEDHGISSGYRKCCARNCPGVDFLLEDRTGSGPTRRSGLRRGERNMPQVELTTDEQSLLAQVLGNYLAGLEVEIAHTDDASFKRMLKAKRDALQNLAAKFGPSGG